MKRELLGAVLLLSATLLGCRATHLAYVNEMTLGVDVAYGNEGTGKLVIGYDRDTFALVPQKAQSGQDGELMSLSAVSGVRVVGLNELAFDHFVATGEAAKAVAKDPEGLEMIRNAIFDRVAK